jgi:hypothetical protein
MSASGNLAFMPRAKANSVEQVARFSDTSLNEGKGDSFSGRPSICKPLRHGCRVTSTDRDTTN